jgi:hypothetical protein
MNSYGKAVNKALRGKYLSDRLSNVAKTWL